MPIPAPNPYDTLPEVPSFTLTSDELTDGGRVPTSAVHDSADGQNISPSLSWSGAPEGTQSYVVTCYDPDAPTGCGFWHWLVVGLGPGVTSLPVGAGAEDSGALAGTVTMRNDFGRHAYDGSAPPPGHGDHRYFFAVHALDTASLGLDSSASAAYTMFNVVAHTLARAVLVSTWSR